MLVVTTFIFIFDFNIVLIYKVKELIYENKKIIIKWY